MRDQEPINIFKSEYELKGPTYSYIYWLFAHDKGSLANQTCNIKISSNTLFFYYQHKIGLGSSLPEPFRFSDYNIIMFSRGWSTIYKNCRTKQKANYTEQKCYQTDHHLLSTLLFLT